MKHQMGVVLGVLIAAALAGCGVDTQYTGAPSEQGAQGEEQTGEEQTGGEQTGGEQTGEGQQGLHLETCGAQRLWETPTQGWIVTQGGFLGVSPHGGLAVRSSLYGESMAYRLRDGSPAFGVGKVLGREAVSADWTRYAELVYSGDGQQARLGLKGLVTDEVLAQSDALPAPSHQGLVVSRDGRRAATLRCGEEDTQLVVWDLEAGQTRAPLSLGNLCPSWTWYPTPPMQMSADGRTLALAGSDDGEVVVVDLDTQRVQTFSAHAPLPEEQRWGYGGAILDLAVRPDGGALATSGFDRKVRVWSLPEMAPLAEFDSDASAINLNSYTPSTASPVRWSQDGRLLAHVAPGGELQLRRAQADFAPLAQLARPSFPREEDQWRGPEQGPPHGLIDAAFSDDLTTLLISSEAGISAWRCPQAALPAPTGVELAVRLDGPARLRVGESATFTATHLGTEHLHGHAFFINGAEWAPAWTGRETSWTPSEPGEYEVSVVIDDGLDTGSASLRVVVE